MPKGAVLFELELEQELQVLEQQTNDWAADVLEYAWRGLFARTPVDSGKFKGSWRVSLGAAGSTVPEARDPGGGFGGVMGITFARGFKVIHSLRSMTSIPTIVLYNNQPYAQRLENGYSSMAPQGIMAITIENVYARYGR